MMILLHLPQLPFLVTLLFSIYVPCFAYGLQNGSIHCNKTVRTCGNTSLSYPFGFSNSCPISLNCTVESGVITIGQFQVQNITADNILVNLPVNCSRKTSDLYTLIGGNYAIHRQNALLFEDCKSPPAKCFIAEVMEENHINLQNCKQNNVNNITCYMFDNGSNGFINKTDLHLQNCKILLTSVAVDMPNTKNSTTNSTTSSPVSLRFESVKLGWWVNGNCNCSENANCSKVMTGNEDGFRCRCLDGFEGDGFAGGEACRKVDNCPKGFSIGHCGGSTKTFILIGGIVLGAALMVITTFLCYIFKRRSKSLKTHKSAKRLLCEVAGNSTVHLYAFKEIEKATNFFSEKQRLGTGAYGTVYAGKVLKSDEWVAIKKIRNRDANGIEQVMNEIKLLSSVSHRNLLRLLGCCIEKGEQILVYEFMPNGTLAEHLQREKGNKSLPWTTRLVIATETAEAIAYLHSAMNPPIFHRDIKSSNILLDYNFNSKVADFGLSRFGMEDDSHISTAPQGTPGYVDPQYHQNFQLSDKSDVYSFGVVLIEIITAMKVIDFSRDHTEVNLAALAIDRIGRGQLHEIIDPLLETNHDDSTLSSIHKVAELAFRCLAFHRDMRPSMTEVFEELDQIRLNAWAPISDDTTCTLSSTTFACSSPFNGSDKSISSSVSLKMGGVTSKMLFVRQRLTDCLVSSSSSSEELKDKSPVLGQDSWKSEQTSPSANSLLRNIVQ